MPDQQVAQSETLEQIAERITRRWGSQYRTQLSTAIVEALRNERDRSIRLIDEHQALDVCLGNCWEMIRNAIREGR